MPDTTSGVEFLKRRHARAIERDDDRTAERLRAEIDRLINGPPAVLRLADRVVDLESRRAAGSTPCYRAHQHDDILYDYDDILGPHL